MKRKLLYMLVVLLVSLIGCRNTDDSKINGLVNTLNFNVDSIDKNIFWAEMVEEFMCPYIICIADFLKSKGVNVVLLDTDGDSYDLKPVFMKAGVTGMYPSETHCGMDIEKYDIYTQSCKC